MYFFWVLTAESPCAILLPNHAISQQNKRKLMIKSPADIVAENNILDEDVTEEDEAVDVDVEEAEDDE